MRSKKLLIALLSVAFCFSFVLGFARPEKASASVTPVTVEDMLANADDLRPAFNYGGGERLSVTDGVISPWNDGHFFYCEEVDAVALDIAFTAGDRICFALRTDGGGQMWTSHGYYAYLYYVTDESTMIELYKVTDCSAWQTAETQLAKGEAHTNLFDGEAHSIVYSFDEETGALTFDLEGTVVTGTDAGEHIAKAGSNFKIARVEAASTYLVSATSAEVAPDPDEPNPDPDEPTPETAGIALTEEIMMANADKLLPTFNYGGAERLKIDNGQISSWSDGNFYYNDLVDSASFTFTAGETQNMLFIALHANYVCIPWASTGYYAFIQDGNASVYKIDADDLSAWTGGILGEAEALAVNVFDGKPHEISFAVEDKTLTFVVDGQAIVRTFEDDKIAVDGTEFGMNSNSTGAFLIGDALVPPVEELDYTGEFTNVETFIGNGAIRADYDYNGITHCAREDGFVLSNDVKMSINATITAIDFDIVVTAGSSMFFAIRANVAADIWATGGYAVWLSGTTLKFFDLSEAWHDAPDKQIEGVPNIFDRERHNVKMYAFDDEDGNVHVGISIDGSAFIKLVDTTAPITLESHTEFWLKSVNDESVRFKITAPEGTEHAYGEPVVTAPKCLEGGFTTVVCEDCGKAIVSDPTEALGHEHQSVVTEPTCIEAGYVTYTCIRCDDSYVGAGDPATGHDHVPSVVEPTCEERGYTKYECACGDSYMEDFVDERGHDLQDATCEEPATCLREGCDYTEGDALGHAYGDWVVVKEATEDEEGEKVKTCETCGDEVSETIPVVEPQESQPEESQPEGGALESGEESQPEGESALESGEESGESTVSNGCNASVGGSLAGVIALCFGIISIKRRRK